MSYGKKILKFKYSCVSATMTIFAKVVSYVIQYSLVLHLLLEWHCYKNSQSVKKKDLDWINNKMYVNSSYLTEMPLFQKPLEYFLLLWANNCVIIQIQNTASSKEDTHEWIYSRIFRLHFEKWTKKLLENCSCQKTFICIFATVNLGVQK